MGLTGTMGEAGTVHRQVTEDGTKHGVVHPFAVAQLPALGTVALGVEVRMHLPFHHDLLDRLEDGLAFRQ